MEVLSLKAMFEGNDEDRKFGIGNCGRGAETSTERTGLTIMPTWFVKTQAEFVIKGFISL